MRGAGAVPTPTDGCLNASPTSRDGYKHREFVIKVVERSGLNMNGTYLPKAINPALTPDPQNDMATAMTEARMVMCGAVEELLAKSGAAAAWRQGVCESWAGKGFADGTCRHAHDLPCRTMHMHKATSQAREAPASAARRAMPLPCACRGCHAAPRPAAERH